MPYIICQSNRKKVVQQGCIVREAASLTQVAADARYPNTESVSPALAYERRSVAQASAALAPPASRKSRYSVELRSALIPPPASAASVFDDAAGSSSVSLSSPLARSNLRPSPPPHPTLVVSQFLMPTTSRFGTSTASPLVPKLVLGVDVQACLSHVALQKRLYFEEQVAMLHTLILGAIPPSLKTFIAKAYPDALKKCQGVLGAMAAVYSAKQAAISPMPNKSSKAFAERHTEVRDVDRRGGRRLSLTALSTSGEYRSSATPTRAQQGQPSAPPPLHGVGAEEITAQLRAGSKEQPTTAVVSPLMSMVAQNSFLFAQQMDSITEDILNAMQHGVATLADEDNDRLIALRQQLVQRRAATVKQKEKASRNELRQKQLASFIDLFIEVCAKRRRAIELTEAHEWLELSGGSTVAQLHIALNARQSRRSVMAANVAATVASQENTMRDDAARRHVQLQNELMEPSRAAERLFSYTEHTVKSAIRQEREARLLAVMQYRRQNPTTYFPDYAEEEIDTEFVPLRIATGTDNAHEARLLLGQQSTDAAP